MLFSNKIKQLRIDSGKRQKDLAKAIGVDVPAYSRYEHGERRPKRDQVLRLARLFKTDPDELVAMWLADEAYSRIAHEKMAHQAATLLQDMLHGAESESAQRTQQAGQKQETTSSVSHGIVEKLGNAAMPLLMLGDAGIIMQSIEDESIDCIVTTPPYWRRRDNDSEGITASSVNEFIAGLLHVMEQAHRVLKPQGSLWLNVGDDTAGGFVRGIPWRLVLAMMDHQGWHLVNEVVWNKITTSPQGSHDHLRKVHESMFHLVKNEDFYYNDDDLRRAYARITRNGSKGSSPEGKGKDRVQERYLQPDSVQGIVPADVWTIGVQRSGSNHYRTAPDMLYRLPIIATCPRGGIVLDPYCGTGTSCRIAYEMNRRSIGIDINPDFIARAKAGIEQKPLSLF